MTVFQSFSLFISTMYYNEQMHKREEGFVLPQNQTYSTLISSLGQELLLKTIPISNFIKSVSSNRYCIPELEVLYSSFLSNLFREGGGDAGAFSNQR